MKRMGIREIKKVNKGYSLGVRETVWELVSPPSLNLSFSSLFGAPLSLSSFSCTSFFLLLPPFLLSLSLTSLFLLLICAMAAFPCAGNSHNFQVTKKTIRIVFVIFSDISQARRKRSHCVSKTKKTTIQVCSY